MLRFMTMRLGGTLLALLVASMIIFGTINAVPGSASTFALGQNPSPQARAAFEARYGLDRPLVEQYLVWASGAVRGDFGKTFQTEIDIREELGRRLPVTLELTFLAFLILMAISLPLAIIAAQRQGTSVDLLASIVILVGLSIPSFVMATVLVLVFSLNLRWLPPGGHVPFLENPVQNLRLMLLPAISLGLVSAAFMMRLFRTSLVDALNKDYVKAARARGAQERRILGVHAIRNAAVPLITVVALELGALFGGAVIIEKIFQLPGIGSFVYLGITSRDYRILQASALVVTAFVLFANFLVDLVAAWLDPRLRRSW